MKTKLIEKLFREITEELKAGNQMRLNVWIRLLEVVKKSPNSPELREELGTQADENPQTNLARLRELSEEINTWADENPRTNLAGLVALYSREQHQLALSIFNNIVENYDPEKDAENLAKTREYLNALLNRGNINEQIRHKPESALTDYATANMLITKSGPLKNELTNCLACVYFYMACLISKDSRDGAAELFTEASKLRHPRAKRSLANLLRATEPEQAEQLLLAAASLGDYPAHLELARIKRDKGDNKAAKQNYLSALDFGDNEAKEELFALLKTEMMSEDAKVAKAAFAEFAGLFLPASPLYQQLGYRKAHTILQDPSLRDSADAHYWLARICDCHQVPMSDSRVVRETYCLNLHKVIYHYYRALQLDPNIASRKKPQNIKLYEESIPYCIRTDFNEIQAGAWRVHPDLLARLAADGDAKAVMAEVICKIKDPSKLLATLKYAFTLGSPLYKLFATPRGLLSSSRPKINAGTFLLIFEHINPQVKKDLLAWLLSPRNELYKILDADEKNFLKAEGGALGIAREETPGTCTSVPVSSTRYHGPGVSQNPMALMGATGVAAAVMARTVEDGQSSLSNPNVSSVFDSVGNHQL